MTSHKAHHKPMWIGKVADCGIHNRTEQTTKVGEGLDPPAQRSVTNSPEPNVDKQVPTAGRVKTLPYRI